MAWLGEGVDPKLLIAGALMALGVWLHLSEQHLRDQVPEPIEHDHAHEHDEHHQHDHLPGEAWAKHSHVHRHTSMTHCHEHFPDEHHRQSH